MYADNEYKLAVILNKKHDIARLLNGAFHAVFGLVPALTDEQLALLDYENEATGIKAKISRYPNVVLAAKTGGQLIRAYEAACQANIP